MASGAAWGQDCVCRRPLPSLRPHHGRCIPLAWSSVSRRPPLLRGRKVGPGSPLESLCVWLPPSSVLSQPSPGAARGAGRCPRAGQEGGSTVHAVSFPGWLWGALSRKKAGRGRPPILARGAITQCHTLRGFSNSCLLLTALEARAPGRGVSGARLWWGPPSRCVLTWERHRGLWHPLLMPPPPVTPSSPSHLRNADLLIPSHWGLGLLTYEFGETKFSSVVCRMEPPEVGPSSCQGTMPRGTRSSEIG